MKGIFAILACSLSLCAAHGNPLQPFTGALAAPSGDYKGSKVVLGETFNGEMDVTSSTSLSFTVSGAFSLKCTEAYTYASGTITLTNYGKDGDCTTDALKKVEVTLKGITYDEASDEITVDVSKSILSIKIVLKKSAQPFPEAPRPLFPFSQLVSTYAPVFAAQKPVGDFIGTVESGFTVQMGVTSETYVHMVVVHADGTKLVDCAGMEYRNVRGHMDLVGACEDVSKVMDMSSLSYDPLSDSFSVIALHENGRSTLDLVRKAEHVSSSSDDFFTQLVDRYYHVFSLAAPAGTYKGNKSVLGQSITATVKIDNTTSMDFDISGPVTISCPGEAYSLAADGTITLPNDTKAGDCIHDALTKYSVTLKTIEYDATSNSITVSLKVSILSISITLNHQDHEEL